jgi:hypothetical protein
MRKGIHGTGRRCLQRIVANGGNRLFIKGGKVKVPIAAPHLTARQKALLFAAAISPDPLQQMDDDGAPTQEAQFKATADAARARRKKGASDDL